MKDMKKVRLVKSRTNKLLTGVCGGIGELIGIDPTIIRLIWAALSLAGGSGVILYIIAAVIIPEDDDIIDSIKELKSETYTSIGTSASGCAYAALDILGIEKYAGDSREVKRYLNCKFDFYKDFVVKAQEMKNKS
mgnify:FL=1